MATLIIKKVGNHWYADVPHDCDVNITLDRKLEMLFNRINAQTGNDYISFTLEETLFMDDISNLICFNEEDITRYFITDDEFNMSFKVNNSCFTINTNVYFYITKALDLNFHFNLYKINLNGD